MNEQGVKAGVLAVMDEAAFCLSLDERDCAAQNLRAGRDIVAELIEADTEYDAAETALRETFGVGAVVNESHPMVQRTINAHIRRKAALARCQPATRPGSE